MKSLFGKAKLQANLIAKAEGFAEFLETWLMLLERLVNPTSVVDSQHYCRLTSSPSVTVFDAHKYLAATQKQALSMLKDIWTQLPVDESESQQRMTDQLLTILCHILQGEAIFKVTIPSNVYYVTRL